MTDSQRLWTPIAIVGASCRLPGACNLDEFWKLVHSAGDATGELPNEILDRELYFDPEPVKLGKSYSTVGGLIPRLPFDNRKCRLPEEELAKYDVSHLTMCEVASEALTDANYDPFDLPLRNAGVYFGHTGGSAIAGELMYAIGVEETAQYLHEVEGLRELSKRQRDEIIERIIEETRRDFGFRSPRGRVALSPVTGCELIARAFGLTGPCVVVDAACASSLQALAIGARALVHKSIDMAIVGGASCCKGDSLVLFSAAQSVTAGKSQPFDSAASGLVTAEGYVTFVMKRLEDAVAAGDRIRGVIRGLGMSSDGKGKSLWAPLKEGQKLAIHRAYDDQVRPSDIQFMEAHATSTQVGDATELAALAEAFPEQLDASQKIPLGSVKANIGHTLETAGVAGLLKALLAMQHGIIPPCANLETPNSEIAWDKLPFRLPRAPLAWNRNGTPTRKAAVNAFGIGGLNVHVVLEEYSADLPIEHYGPAAQKSHAASRHEPIAVIGMGAILPGVRSVDEFWQLLNSGRDPKSEVTPDRWNAELCFDPSEPRPYRSYNKLGGFCTDYQYDWRKHRVPPKQVAAANPLQFMLLDAADQALAQGGCLGREFDRERVGVIVGTNFGGDFSDDLQMGLKLPDFHRRLSRLLAEQGWNDDRIARVCQEYQKLLLARKPALIDETGSFTSSTLASRITKTFNLKGGALAMDAGVGTGLAALSAAVDALRSGDCDMMICAAGQRSMDLSAFEGASEARLLAKGRPAPAFDKQADGYVLGEGCAVLLLKRLSDAKRDNDQVLGVVHDVAGASDWNFDGKAYEVATQRVLQGAGIAGEAVRCVEAMGTLPGLEEAEVRPLAKLLVTPERSHELAFSSIVPQFGYLGAAHSLAATIKACLAVSHGKSPVPTPPQQVRGNLFPPGTVAQLQPEALGDPACSAISVLGGPDRGTCYHAIVGPERIPAARTAVSPGTERASGNAQVIRIGASNWDQLHKNLQVGAPTAAWEAGQQFTLADTVRLAIVSEDAAELAAIWEELRHTTLPGTAQQRKQWAARGVFWGEPRPETAHCAFIFPGHSSQYPGMFAEAISGMPAAALARRQADAALASLGFESFEDLAGKQATGLGSNLWKTQAGILVGSWVGYGALRSLGLRPSIAMGHSFGEYMALLAAGAWSLTEAIRAARIRAEAINSLTDVDGTMAATGADRETLQEVLDKIDGVFIANYNSPRQTVISGHRQAVLKAVEQLKAHRASAAVIAVPSPFHCPLLQPASELLARRITDLPIRRTEIPVVSTVGSGLIRDVEQIIDSLARQLVTPVDFPQMLGQMLATRPALVVEVGPKQILTRLCETNHPDSDVLFMASDNPKRPGQLSFLDVAAQADCLGCLDARTSEMPAAVPRRPSKHAARVMVFDATERRRQRMRLQSAQVADPQTPKARQRNGSEKNGNGNGHHQRELTSSAAPAAVATSAVSRLVPTEPARAVAARGPQPTAARPALQEPVQPADEGSLDIRELRQILIDFVVEQTGYPDDMVELDADLEADLGIDSIKKAQLFGEVGARFSIAPREDLSLDDFPTLQHVVDFLARELGMATPKPFARAEEVAVPDKGPASAATVAVPAAVPAGSEPREAGTDIRELRQILIEFVVEQTGYPDDMIELDADLEADLGIDSIKKAQLFGEVGSRFSIAPREDLSLDDFPTLQHVVDFLVQELDVSVIEPPAAASAKLITEVVPSPAQQSPVSVSASTVPSPSGSANVDVSELRQILVEFVVEQTGYPEDMIEMDADLEADLGIDSIKKAQLFGEVGSRFSIAPREDLSLDDFPTLQHVVDFLLQELSGSAAVSLDPSEVTSIIDETSTRSMLPTPTKAPTPASAPTSDSDSPRAEKSASAAEATGLDVEELRRILVEFVVDQTGYPEDMIELDADLEADLGIDSIKKAQLFGEVGAQFSLAPREDLSLDDFPTLQHVIDFLVVELALDPGTSGTGVNELSSVQPVPEGSGLQPDDFRPEGTPPEFIKLVELSGNATNRGEQQGKSCRGEIQKNVMRLVSEATDVGPTATNWTGEYQSEFAAIATAALVNEESIRAWNAVESSESLRVGFAEATPPCEIHDGVAAMVQVRQSDSGLRYITIGHAGQLTVPFGINSARLAVSSVAGTDAPPSSDIAAVAQKLHEVLGHCQSVEDAQRKLQTLQLQADWVIGLSDLRADAPVFLRISGRGATTAGEAAQTQRDFHNACAQNPSDIEVFDRQSQARKTIALDELLPRTATRAPSLLLPVEQQIFQRHVLRMVPAAVTYARDAALPVGEAALVVGDGPVAFSVRDQLLAQGCLVELVSTSAWPASFQDRLDTHRPRHLMIVAPSEADLDHFRPSHQFTSILAGCQHWIDQLEQSGSLAGATLSAITSMGGDFGFASRGRGFAGGALTGLFKGIRREYPGLRVKVVDCVAKEPPSEIAAHLLQELQSDCPQLEVGYRQRERFVVRAVPSPSELTDSRPSPGDVWVVTGGGRGVTAAVAKAIGEAYGLSLHLLGTAPQPDPAAVWRGLDEQDLKGLRRKLALQAREQGEKPDKLWRTVEKAMELDRTLEAFKQAGIRAQYHQCDVADQESLNAVLEVIRQTDGPIRGIVHGAGVEAACRFSRKQPEMVQATIASKCDGGSNLISLTRNDPLKYFVGFGSTSGRFGGLGQADYSLASDLLAKMVGRLAEERPDCKAVCFHWPAWDEVGMAARPESRMALERGGLSFMSPAEGVSHFAAELAAAGHEHEILILNDPGLLDTDGTMSRREAPVDPETFRHDVAPEAAPQTLASTVLASGSTPAPVDLPTSPLVCNLRPGPSPDDAYVDFTLDAATDPFLIHHQLRGKSILPAVMTMQIFSEAARLLRPDDHVLGLSNVSLGNGLSVGSNPIRGSVRMRRTPDGVRCELLAPFVNSRGEVLEQQRVHASATVDFGTPESLPPVKLGEPLFGWSQFIYPPVAPIRHGAPLQTFKSLAYRHGEGLALIEGRDPQQLLGERKLHGIALPSAELDGCLVACGFFVFAMVEQSFNLPSAIAKYRLGRGATSSAEYKMAFTYLGRSENGHRFDFLLADGAGNTLFEVKGYDTVAIKE